MKSQYISAFLLFSLMLTLLCGIQPLAAKPSGRARSINGDDSLLWKSAQNFTTLFNKGDTAAMNAFLPDDFMLQWMHENFLTKKGIIKAMTDTVAQKILQCRLDHDSTLIIRYSDDRMAAGINTGFVYMDPATMRSVQATRGYGLFILYFQKINGEWKLETIHMDLHCSLCNW